MDKPENFLYSFEGAKRMLIRLILVQGCNDQPRPEL